MTPNRLYALGLAIDDQARLDLAVSDRLSPMTAAAIELRAELLRRMIAAGEVPVPADGPVVTMIYAHRYPIHPSDSARGYTQLSCECGHHGPAPIPTDWGGASVIIVSAGDRCPVAMADRIASLERALRGAREIIHVAGPVRQERCGPVPLWKLANPALAEDVAYFLEVAGLTATGTPK